MWLTGMEPSEIAQGIRELLARVADPAHVSGIVVSGASIAPPPPSSTGASVSFTLHNRGTAADELVGARAPIEVAGAHGLARPVALPPHADAVVAPGPSSSRSRTCGRRWRPGPASPSSSPSGAPPRRP